MADTLLAERIDAPAPVSRRNALLPVLTTLPWALVIAALLLVWSRGDVPAPDLARFSAYWVFALVLPGTLAHRALRGSRGNLPEDLAYGAATGLLLEIVAWALAAATGQQSLLRWWPLPVILAFAAVPGLRRHWRVGERRPLPVVWHWAMGAALLVVVAWGYIQWRMVPLPPVYGGYYQDLLYHLGLVQELTRAMPFELPHVAGEGLRYHYLSDAHIASASMITDIAPTTVLLRLWLVPVIGTAVVLAAGLARDLSGAVWAGPVVAVAGFVGTTVTLGSAVGASGEMPLSYASPSQTYVLVPLLLLVGLCVDVARGRSLGLAWALVPVLGLVCAGAKSSALPPLIAGLGLTAAVFWWRERRVPRPALVALACLVAAMALGFRLFAGGGASTLRVQALALLHFIGPYSETLGGGDGIWPDAPLPPGINDGGALGWLLAFSVVAWWVLGQAPRWVGMTLLVEREHRADAAVWLLAGTVLAGAATTWVFQHPSISQIYFWMGVIPVGAVLTAWSLAVARAPWPVLVVPAVAGALAALATAGTVAGLALPKIARPGTPYTSTIEGWLRVLGVSAVRYVLFVIVAAALAVGVAARWRRRVPSPGGRRRAVTIAVAGVTAAMLGASGAVAVGGIVRSVLTEPVPATGPQPYALTADEMRAALWLDEHAADDDVVATNVHCRPVQTTQHCDARAFWVTGLGGHRTVVESWGYTDAVVAAHGVDNLGYARQNFPDRELLAFNDRVFTAPTIADLDRLRVQHGVRWLFADARAGAVSPELARLAQVRLVAGSVTVYEVSRP
ncbi:hypothetical protein [Micromonospora parathelypteridis]|uniref:Uncharacterized protein n=1 Tax=Micromonospora parathelypteridis TaxID=1839617 RepID=A0A840W0W5_9ACTN|nr:hypothetical protein [Micromonospora parathelypteridis]MBB5478470.1 hypothetical protein [Micromonospora parathelypteridis]GGO06081.1 hypothetical protein GCM10011576_09400 [Micromonospora parathelypteridis]